MRAPVFYSPDLEVPEQGEAETAAALVDTMLSISEKTYEDSGGAYAMRSVHVKNDGILKGKMEVFADLPDELAQGVFARPGSHDVVMRLSTSPGDIIRDSISTARGLGLKISNAQGETLPGTNGHFQNLVLVNDPAFMTADAKSFLTSIKPVAMTTNKAEGVKAVLSAGLQKVEEAVEALGGRSAKLINTGGHPETHILGESFFTEVPFLYGPYIAKFSVAPVSPALKALTGVKLDMKDRPNALREAVREFFAQNDAEWEMRVQLCRDIETMPIENAAVKWPEDTSPYIAVARIIVARDGLLSEEEAAKEEDVLSFNPWHGLAAHRPLGSINRARRPAYERSAAFRASRNGCPMKEPRSSD